MRVLIGFVSSPAVWAAPETIDRSFTGMQTVEIYVEQRSNDADVKLVGGPLLAISGLNSEI